MNPSTSLHALSIIAHYHGVSVDAADITHRFIESIAGPIALARVPKNSLRNAFVSLKKESCIASNPLTFKLSDRSLNTCAMLSKAFCFAALPSRPAKSAF
ncbi:hypothetical protein VQ643_16120 [Pseudomonas sp. F1_0610]|uniref:hypothetical protein n=1 Tax=Pseudomonas sp. F1_0610 TaxID=3114284 RepID=UPI0039C380B6